MTLTELIRRFRVLARDSVANPYLFSDTDVTDWLNDAQIEAAVRARLLLEDADPALCEVAVLAGTHTYQLHQKLYEIEFLRFLPSGAIRAEPVPLVSREWLDANVCKWRDLTGRVEFAVQGETRLRLVGVPGTAGTLLIDGYRLPLAQMTGANDEPEIHQASHEKLIYWALHRAFSIPDTEAFDPVRSKTAEDEFSRHFGLAVDAGLRRATRTDQDQGNKLWLP